MKPTALLFAALLLAGCSSTTPDDAYVSTVKENVTALADAPDAELIELGKNVCGLFDEHGFAAGFPELLSEWEQAGITASEAAQIAGAATGAYCPEYADEF